MNSTQQRPSTGEDNMGGNAFKSLPRLTKEQHSWILDTLLRTAPEDLQVHPELPLLSKQSFGDVDVFVKGTAQYMDDAKFLNWLNKSFVVVGSQHNTNSHVFHYLCRGIGDPDVDNMEFQVDIVVSPDPRFTALYCSGGYFGQLMGVIAKSRGLKLTMTALYQPYEDSAGQHHQLMITDTIHSALHILGEPRWKEHYKDARDMCSAVATSKFFRPSLFTSNCEDKDLEALFITLSAYPECSRASASLTTSQLEIVNRRIQEIEDEILRKREVRQKFNGELVQLWTGLPKGEELGKFMKFIKSELYDYTRIPLIDDLCEHRSSEFIEAVIREMWSNYNKEET